MISARIIPEGILTSNQRAKNMQHNDGQSVQLRQKNNLLARCDAQSQVYPCPAGLRASKIQCSINPPDASMVGRPSRVMASVWKLWCGVCSKKKNIDSVEHVARQAIL